tara:strand:+ start:204 stop:854 length:651 start_codon:yes stop_codon:yes gene_type:complete
MNVRVDNRYVYKYLEEQHQRDAARTLGVQAENKKKEVPFLLARYGGIALIILFIGLALYLANSYKKIIKGPEIGNGFNEDYYGTSSDMNRPSGTDDIIDIESLLEDQQAKDHFQIENNENIPSNVVRNYVIFDRTDLNIGNITELYVGRRYEDPNSEPSRLWCYVNVYGSGGIGTDFHFIVIEGDKRTENKITNEALNLMGISLDKAMEVRKLCNI